MPVPVSKTALTGGRTVRSVSIGKHVCSLLLQAFITIPCFSQIGNWNFNSSTSGTGGTHNTVSNSDFSAAIPTKAYNGSTVYYGEGGWPAGALDPSAYLEFTITPNTGYQLDLTSVVITMRRSTTGTSAGSGPTSWSLRSGLDGYAADLASNSLTTSIQTFTVPLGSSFLMRPTAVTFRLYGYNAVVTTGGLSRVVMDNLSINGIGSVLPATITGIQAFRNNKDIAVKCALNNVEAGTVLQVQRSANGIDYSTLNNYIQSEFKTAYTHNYLDGQVPAVYSKLYYRIKGATPDGRTFLSPVVTVNNNNEVTTAIDYASVQGQLLYTSVQVAEKGNYTISLVAMNGAMLQSRVVNLEAGVHVLPMPLHALMHGTYVVRLTGNKLVNSKMFVW